MLRILFMLFAVRAAKANMSCENARIKCAYREGCAEALQNYMIGCSQAFHGSIAPNYCPEACQLALIALTSTEVGKEMMNCECEDEMCRRAKRNVEVCKPYVLKATRSESIVSCEVARSICEADTTCYAALAFYHRYCKLMFEGKKCSHRCKNSINILRRQQNAAKLETCKCSGREEYDCPLMKTNMARLCFPKKPPPAPPMGDVETNEIVPSLASSSFPFNCLLLCCLLLSSGFLRYCQRRLPILTQLL
uniref:Growth arrest-specific protein 1 n=1 Tax=Cacopsylla melanoneura TaxID=428564 RepID=A0A8D9ADA3_9HEMI